MTMSALFWNIDSALAEKAQEVHTSNNLPVQIPPAVFIDFLNGGTDSKLPSSTQYPLH